MKRTTRVLALSIVVGVAVLGLPAGCGVKSSGDKKTGGKGTVRVSMTCGTNPTIYVFPDGISVSNTGAGDDHLQTYVCPGDTITWKAGPPAGTVSVSGFQVFFDESPCEGGLTFPPALYPASGSPLSIMCPVYSKVTPGTSGLRVHKYELIITDTDSNNNVVRHRYLDP